MFIALYDAPKSDSAAKQWMWIVTLHPKQDRNQELLFYIITADTESAVKIINFIQFTEA